MLGRGVETLNINTFGRGVETLNINTFGRGKCKTWTLDWTGLMNWTVD